MEKTVSPMPEGNYKRQWVRCERHGNEGYYDYVPYSLSTAFLIMNCGCDAGRAPGIAPPDWAVEAQRVADEKQAATKLRDKISRAATDDEKKLVEIIDCLPDASLKRLNDLMMRATQPVKED